MAEYTVRALEESRRASGNNGICYPQWLVQAAGEREREVMYHPDAKIRYEDIEGFRVPNHQQLIISPVGRIWICSHRRAIVG